jgi:hypothetical protein
MEIPNEDLMTDKKKTVSKADAIRKVAAALKAKGETPRPVVIRNMLAKDGIEVYSCHVSMTLKSAGYPPVRKRAGATRDAAVTLDDMIKAKKIIDQFGGVERFVEAKKIIDRFGGIERLLKVVEGIKHFQS